MKNQYYKAQICSPLIILRKQNAVYRVLHKSSKSLLLFGEQLEFVNQFQAKNFVSNEAVSK